MRNDKTLTEKHFHFTIFELSGLAFAVSEFILGIGLKNKSRYCQFVVYCEFMKNLSVQHQIASIFNDAQRTLNHKQLIKSMLVLYKQHQHSFVPKFKTMVNKILPVATKESSIDKLIKFIGEAVCQSSSIKRSEFQSSQNSEESDDEAEEDETLLNIMFRHFIDTSQAKSKAIRWRSCQIISAILGGLDKDFDIEYKFKFKIPKKSN